MKRVLVLNGDSYVGRHVCRSFYNSREYEVEVTLSTMLKRDRLRYNNQIHGPGIRNPPSPTEVPSDMSSYVSRVVINHNESPDEFRVKVLENDVIIAILEDDAYEAECTARVLLGSHYEVEKTFVLVSSMMTWAETLSVERAKVRAERQRAAALERAAELEYDDASDLPAGDAAMEKEEEEDYPDEELVPSREFAEEDYAQRVPHPRYQHWQRLERLVKHANSETLHTYVVAAGMAYGEGEGPLEDFLRAAWRHQPLEPLLPLRYDRFKRRHHRENVIPMIHVRDLATILYEVGSCYDVLEERYLFAVDQGNCTVQEILDAVKAGFGDGVAWGSIPSISAADEKMAFEVAKPTAEARGDHSRFLIPSPPPLSDHEVNVNAPSSGYWSHFLLDLRTRPGKVLSLYEPDRWMALEGFVENFDKVLFQFRRARDLQPCRILVTGPPLSGSETVALRLAAAYRVPVITAELAAAAYQRYVVELREELCGLLLKRLERRRNRAHARRFREKREAEEEAERQRRLEREAAADGDSDNEEAEERDEYEEDKVDDESGSDLDSNAEAGSDGEVSKLSEVFTEDRFEVDLASKLTDAYLLGEPGGPDDESVEESEEDEDLLMDDADDEELTTTQRCIRLQMIERDRGEKVRIQMLRHRYRLALKVLSMKLVNGFLPSPAEEDEESLAGDAARPRGGGLTDAEDHEAADPDDDDEEAAEEAEEDAEASEDGSGRSRGSPSGASSAALPGGAPAGDATGPPARVRYLDEAVAFFVRWRLRRADCRHHGFVLHGYPRTVNEARLVFRATADDDEGGARLRGRRRRVPAAPAEVPPPVDFDFPLVDVAGMTAAERAAYTAGLLGHDLGTWDSASRDTAPPFLPAAPEDDGADGEGLLRPVSEALLPAHVVVVDRRDGLAAAAAAGLASAPGGGGGGRPAWEDDAAWLCFFDGAVEDYGGCMGGGGGDHPRVTAPPMADFQTRMSAYRVHHGYPADGFSGETTPSRSLLTWLQSVSTTDVLGATAEPVVVHAAKPIRDDDDGGEEGGDLDGDAAATQPFSSSRTAQITILEAPCRTAEVTLRELREALRAARFQMIQGLSGRPLQALDLGREVVSLSHDRPNREESISFRKIALSYISSPIPGIFTPEGYSMGQERVTTQSPSSTVVESPLWELVDRLRYTVLDKYFMPNSESQPAPERDPKSDIDVSLGSFKSAEFQVGSTDGTLEITSSMPHLMDESSQSMLMLSERELNLSKLIGQELLAIKHLNISEEAINYQIAAQMPMEKYLVTYVLPSLTPALTEVVKLRPDDPITVLADILYDCKRRTDV